MTGEEDRDRLPVLDETTLDAIRALGDESFLRGMLEIYLGSAEERIRAIEAGIARGAFADVRDAAHALKSSSAQLGAMRLSRACRDLERAGENGGDAARRAILVELQEAWSALRPILASRLSGSPPTPS